MQLRRLRRTCLDTLRRTSIVVKRASHRRLCKSVLRFVGFLAFVDRRVLISGFLGLWSTLRCSLCATTSCCHSQSLFFLPEARTKKPRSLPLFFQQPNSHRQKANQQERKRIKPRRCSTLPLPLLPVSSLPVPPLPPIRANQTRAKKSQQMWPADAWPQQTPHTKRKTNERERERASSVHFVAAGCASNSPKCVCDSHENSNGAARAFVPDERRCGTRKQATSREQPQEPSQARRPTIRAGREGARPYTQGKRSAILLPIP